MVERRLPAGAAFYARHGGKRADWWTLLHPPYTIWHLSYVVMGAALAPRLSRAMLGATILAFFLAVGLAAHALDELHGRPLDTTISAQTLRIVAATSLAGAVVLGALAVPHSSVLLVPCIAIGVLLVLGYNLELLGGRLHTDIGFAVAWGGFPVLVGFLAQAPPMTEAVTVAALALALATTALSYTQRRLSTPARELRRRVSGVHGVMTMTDGTRHSLDRTALLAPLEAALKALSIAMPMLALTLLLART
ncbi:MAG: hypothetical protein JWO57_1865 [Pseudonocardiales bacterium]|nr:hypothetical protein [Pseudonocardiales bacterium]